MTSIALGVTAAVPTPPDAFAPCGLRRSHSPVIDRLCVRPIFPDGWFWRLWRIHMQFETEGHEFDLAVQRFIVKRWETGLGARVRADVIEGF